MLIQIGKGPAAPGDEGVVEALLACHERIRGFCALATRLATDAHASPHEIARAAEMVRRYFSVALPLHAQDEDLDLRRALLAAGGAPELAGTLERIAREHVSMDELLADLVPRWERIEVEPLSVGELSAQLVVDTNRLRAMFEPHLELEETIVFPAVARLDPAELDTIQRAMRARRAPPA
jgi:hemerythrin-like domain-containing protein